MDLKWRASMPSVRCCYLDRAENCYRRYALWIHDGDACKSVGVEFAVRTIRIASKSGMGPPTRFLETQMQNVVKFNKQFYTFVDKFKQLSNQFILLCTRRMPRTDLTLRFWHTNTMSMLCEWRQFSRHWYYYDSKPTHYRRPYDIRWNFMDSQN